MGKWTKKTDAEIAEADKKRDYTCGYEFGPWLLYMRKMYVLGFLGNLLAGWIGGINVIMGNDNPLWMGFAIIGFFGVFAPILIASLLRRDYKMSKIGQSS